jgi:2-polyprenyl-6-methoxyphenol hydroxylase-like FAD-dependent oxidoreductase
VSASILIVGAGPVGLALALALARYGLYPRVIDKLQKRLDQSKALSVSAASLKVFRALGVQSEFESIGAQIRDIYIYFEGKRCAHINKRYLGQPYDYYLSLPQPETERILERSLRDLGIVVDYGHEILDVHEGEGSAAATISNIATGVASTSDYHAIVACDGAHSSVRRKMGIAFDGVDYNMHFIMGDVLFASAHNDRVTSYHVTSDGFMIFLPMQNGLTRLVISRNGDLPPGRTGPDWAELQEALDRYYPKQLRIMDVRWSSSARIFSRVAHASRAGRVYLAGDALHLFSPIGGQGMNTGLQDAINLGWKLAFAVKGVARPSLLESYHAERQVAIQRVLGSTHRNTMSILRRTGTGAAESAYSPHFANRKLYREGLPFEFAGLAADHSAGPQALVGKHVPYCASSQPYLMFKSTYDIPRRGRNVALTLSPEIAPMLRATSARYPEAMMDVVLRESERPWARPLGLTEAEVCLVRPDGYVGYHGSASGLGAYMAAFYY